jgi:hypothetical protein
VAYPHEAALCPPLVPGKHIAYCRPDLKDLVEICQHYLTHDEERQAMIQASREYFDAFLHRDCIAAYYLERLAMALGLSVKWQNAGSSDSTMGGRLANFEQGVEQRDRKRAFRDEEPEGLSAEGRRQLPHAPQGRPYA